MNIEKIEKFIDAGYTKEEINKLFEGGNSVAVQKTDEHGAEGAEHEEPKEQGAADTPHDSAVTSEMLKTLTDTVAGLQETVKALQEQNVKSAKSDSPKTTDKIKAAMDSFINEL